jgi:hypothetical protein
MDFLGKRGWPDAEAPEKRGIQAISTGKKSLAPRRKRSVYRRPLSRSGGRSAKKNMLQ